MGEIKSTLDLVMERTKNLSLTKDEKKKQAIDAAKKNFFGSVQKYLDKVLDLDGLRRVLSELQEKYPDVDAEELRGVLMDIIDLEALNGPLPDLLHSLFGSNIEGLLEVGRRYRKQLSESAEKRAAQLVLDFKNLFKISGSAVIPNLHSDAQWIDELEQLKTNYEQQLFEEKATCS